MSKKSEVWANFIGIPAFAGSKPKLLTSYSQVRLFLAFAFGSAERSDRKSPAQEKFCSGQKFSLPACVKLQKNLGRSVGTNLVG
jgi:hypothetical protein